MELHWEVRRRDERIRRYLLSAILEDLSMLLGAAQRLWHPWSLQRKSALASIAYQLSEGALHARRKGVQWVCEKIGVDRGNSSPTHVLGQATYLRNYQELVVTPQADAAMRIVATVGHVMIRMLPVFAQAEGTEYAGECAVKAYSKLIEPLMEFPGVRDCEPPADEVFAEIGTLAFQLECEGLAFTQAMIEDGYKHEHPEKKQRQRSRLSDEQLRALADEIGTTFENLKSVFETVHSSWWEQSRMFRSQADPQLGALVRAILGSDSTREAFVLGTPETPPGCGGYPGYCWDEQTLTNSEHAIATLLMLLTHPQEFSASALPT